MYAHSFGKNTKINIIYWATGNSVPISLHISFSEQFPYQFQINYS